MAVRVWDTGLVLLLIFGRLTYAEPAGASLSPVCPERSVTESIFRFRASSCPLDGDEFVQSIEAVNVVEGDEVSLQKALNLIHKRAHDNVALLFYASWCPFSGTFRPTFSILSSLYPSVLHFAIEESVIRPSTLSKYGVHGFPVLFLMNSTMHRRYQGPRTLDSLAAFYSDFTGCKVAPLDGTFVNRTAHLPDHEKHENNEEESCPFSWARSPENLLHQETYLALATAFVLLRLLCLAFPTLQTFAWRRYILHMRLRYLWEHPLAFLNRAIQLFNSLKEPCKRSNLQEGAMNARAWASKSLASVSFGDASSSRAVPVS